MKKSGISARIKSSYILLVLFITLFSLGLAFGGFGKVLANGAVVCLDCIGLY